MIRDLKDCTVQILDHTAQVSIKQILRFQEKSASINEFILIDLCRLWWIIVRILNS